ncbi:MAG: Asp-tRNA(Asn)/Glu-tRNA(Gln) amidotransferase subunit GatC [Verrucomicrobiota bacterium]
MKKAAIDVSYVADLARIELTEKEKELFQKQLGDVLDYVEQLQKIDTSSVADSALAPDFKANTLRADTITDSLSVDDALLNAPQQNNDLIIAPKIVE